MLSYCTAIQGVELDRCFYIPFIYVTLLVVVCCVTLVNLGLRTLALYIFTKYFDRLDTNKNTYCPNFKIVIFLSQR